MIHKLLFICLIFVAFIGMPGSIYFSKNIQDTRTHVFAEKKIIPSPTPTPKTLGAMQEATDDANDDDILNILDYNLLIDCSTCQQTTLKLFLQKITTTKR